MFKHTITTLLSTTCLVYAYGNSPVDYWGIPQKQETKQEAKQETKQEKELSDEELLKESIKWYEEKIKKEKSPVEYAYFKDPERYKEAYWKWLSWQQDKNNSLVNPVVMYSRLGSDWDKMIDYFKVNDYRFMYFYKEGCEYCLAMEGEIRTIEASGIKVYRISVEKDRDVASKWNITMTPTVIMVSPKDRKAYRIEGYMTANEVISNFFKLIKGGKQ